MRANVDKPRPLIAFHERGGLIHAERDGMLVSIDEVDNGLACGCRCPACGAPLIAKQGQTKHHFAHKVDTGCKSGFETALHMMAKEVLAQALTFRLPAFCRGRGNKREEIIEERVLKFDRAVLEKRTGRIVPDVILYAGNRPLLVELVVTHWCDQEKIDLMKVADLSCVEVNLGPFRAIWTKESLREIVVDKARRTWLNNPVADRKAAKLDADRAAKYEHKVVGHADRLHRFYNRVSKKQPVHADAAPDQALMALNLDGAIGLPIVGDSCFGSAGIWQKTIIERLIKNGRGGSAIGLPTKDILGWVKSLLSTDFSDWLPEDVREDVKVRVPEFRSAYDVVLAYLKELEDRQIVTFRKGWHLNERLRQRILAQSRHSELRVRRHEKVHELVTDILGDVPDIDKRSFDYQVWLDRPCELALTPRQVIDMDCIIESFPSGAIRNTEEYCELVQGLRRVSTMLAGLGPIVEDLFNLPVKTRVLEIEAIKAFEAEEAEKRRLLRVWEDGVERERILIQTLKSRYPNHDITALVSERLFDSVPAFKAVRSSDVSLERVLHQLDTELAREVEEAARKSAMEQLQQKLLSMCDRTVDPQIARLFLTTSNPAYGGRPIETCVDDSNFQLLWLAASDRANGGKIAWRK